MSIENQSYKEMEVVLVNDGSTDGSEEICKEFVKRNNKFRLINQVNSGVCEARNRGIRESKGNYISFIDSDDTITRDFLESLWKALHENHADMAQCDRRINGVKEHPDWDTKVFGRNDIFPEYLKNTFLNSVCVKLYKRELIEDIAFPLGRPIMEDACWTSHVLERCGMIVRIGEAKYDYRMVATSQTHTRLSEEKECGKFRNQIEKATVIERHINDKESLDKLYVMVADFIPWVLGSHDNLDLFDTYCALRFLAGRLYKRGYRFESFEIILRNSDFKKAQDEYLWYGLKSGEKNLKYKLNMLYRRVKRRRNYEN